MARPGWGATVTIAGLLVLVGLGPMSTAHNPALTVYEPASLGDGLLVLGEEGTAAHLTLEGQERWSTQLGVQIVQAPATGHGLGVTYARNLTTLESQAIAFDEEGVAWRTDLGQRSTVGWVVPAEDGFAAISGEGNLTLLDDEGQVTVRHDLAIQPVTYPAAHPESGWILADRQGNLAVVDARGQVVAETDLGVRAWTVTTGAQRILVGHGSVPDRVAGLVALSPDLDELWRQDVPGFRTAGIALLDDGRFAFGTYRSQGAHVAVLTTDGQVSWQKGLGGNTAAAAATDGQHLFITTNGGVQAMDAQGADRWQAELSPRLTAATVTDGLVLPSGAENRLVALDAGTGQVAWTWDDGVREVPWTDETLTPQETGTGPGSSEEPSGTPLGPAATLLALAGVALLRARR